jgi:ribonuclease Z
MIIKCFGTAGYHPSEDRHTSCYYIPELSLLLDAGTGIFRLTAELLAEPRESVDIWLSHAHLDHVVGLTFLLDTMAVTTLKHVRVFGEAAKLKAIRERIYHEMIFPVEPAMEFMELPDSSSPFLVSGYRDYFVQWLPLMHPGGAVGYVIEYSGKRLAYITDTTAYPDSPYLEELHDLDLLLHECNFGDEHQALAEKTGHSWQSAVEGVVKRCQPRQTQLIHHNPLAEILGIALSLTPEQKKLGMHLTKDCNAIEF